MATAIKITKDGVEKSVTDWQKIVWNGILTTEGSDFVIGGDYITKPDGTKVSMVEETKTPIDKWIERWYEKNKA